MRNNRHGLDPPAEMVVLWRPDLISQARALSDADIDHRRTLRPTNIGDSRDGQQRSPLSVAGRSRQRALWQNGCPRRRAVGLIHANGLTERSARPLGSAALARRAGSFRPTQPGTAAAETHVPGRPPGLGIAQLKPCALCVGLVARTFMSAPHHLSSLPVRAG